MKKPTELVCSLLASTMLITQLSFISVSAASPPTTEPVTQSMENILPSPSASAAQNGASLTENGIQEVASAISASAELAPATAPSISAAAAPSETTSVPAISVPTPEVVSSVPAPETASSIPAPDSASSVPAPAATPSVQDTQKPVVIPVEEATINNVQKIIAMLRAVAEKEITGESTSDDILAAQQAAQSALDAFASLTAEEQKAVLDGGAAEIMEVVKAIAGMGDTSALALTPFAAPITDYPLGVTSPDSRVYGGITVQYSPGAPKIVLTAKDNSREYGTAYQPTGIVATVYGVSASDGFNISTVFGANNFGLAIEGNTAQDVKTEAGTYTIYPICDTSAVTFNSTVFSVTAEKTGKLAVTRRPITLTIDDAYKTYGEGDPKFEYTVKSGSLANNDTFFGKGVFRVKNTPTTEQVGSYPLDAELTNKNYDITVEKTGKLYISKAQLIITGGFTDADNNFKQVHTREYGNKDLPTGYSISGLATHLGDAIGKPGLPGNLGSVSVSFHANSTSIPGDYNVVPSGLSASLTNYDVTYNKGTLSVIPRNITITMDEHKKEYGEIDPELTHVITAPNAALPKKPTTAWDGASLTSLVGNITRALGEDAGIYAYVNGYTADKNPNYTISLLGPDFEITQAALTVTVEDVTRPYGEENPAFSVHHSGFKLSDDISILTGVLVYSCAADKTSGVNDYEISASGYDPHKNYTIIYKPGTLTVVPREINMAIDNQSSVYGEPLKPLTYTVTCLLGDALVNGDVLEGELSTRPVGAKEVGTYDIISSYSHPNYNILVKEGKYTIAARPITIIIDDKTSVYGEEYPELTYTISSPLGAGLVPGDTLAGRLSVDSSSGIGVGPHRIISSLRNKNYDISVREGTLTITPRPITVVVDSKKSVYGDDIPALSYTLECALGPPLVNGDILAGSLSVNASKLTGVGEYDITSSLNHQNYTISVRAGKLQITPAVVSVSLDEMSKLYGTKTIEPKLSFSGFKNGDDQQMFSLLMLTTLSSSDSSLLPNITITVADDVSGIKGYTGSGETKKYENAFTTESITFGNYTFTPASSSLNISRLAPENTMYQADGAKKTDALYGGNVTLSSKEGYKLSYSDLLDNNEWVDSLTITGDGVHNIQFYIIRLSDGAITNSVQQNISIDSTVPAPPPAPALFKNPLTGTEFGIGNIFLIISIILGGIVIVLKVASSRKRK